MRASIIIANSNCGQALARTVTSCLQASKALDCEVIVADDASTDASVRDVSSGFPQISLVRNERRRGVSATRALGADHARGDVLIFLDGGSNIGLDAVQRLVCGCEQSASKAVVTPSVRAVSSEHPRVRPPAVVHGHSPDLDTLSWRDVGLEEMSPKQPAGHVLYESPAAVAMPLAMSRELYDAIAGFSSWIGDGGCDSLHVSLKCWLMGFEILHDPEAVVEQRLSPSPVARADSSAAHVADQIAVARINFCPGVWDAWVERCRERNDRDLPGHPEGLWAAGWRLFELRRAEVEREREYVHGRRARDEFWYAEHFGMAWPRLEGAVPTYRAPAGAAVGGAAAAAVGAGVTPSPTPTPQVVNPTITLASQAVVVTKTYTNPARQRVTLRTSAAFPRTGTLVRTGAAIRFFTAAVGGSEITFNGTDNVFPGAQLTAGIELFAQGAQASAALNDQRLTLTLAAGSNPGVGPPAVATMTAVELTLDICSTRTVGGTDPNPLPQPPAAPPATPTDKWFGGRVVHLQDTGHHQGRALVIVRQVRPAAFAGTLVLRQVAVAGNAISGLDTRVHAFDNETATGGDAAKPNPFEIVTTTIPAGGRRLWAEGATTSAALRDTGFQLGIKGLENDGDRVRLTVARLKNLVADIPATPAHTARMGNSPVTRHTLTRGAGAAPTPSDYSEDFTVNTPLVLVEDGASAASPVNLSVVVEPAGIPLSWSVLRDARAAPDGDAAGVVAVSPHAVPTLVRNAADSRRATIQADAVGSFYVRAFVDVNANARFDRGIDIEPFMMLPLVLVRVTQNQDNTVAQNNFNVGAGGAPGSIGVSSGSFNIGAPATAAVHFSVLADVVGGGGDGRRGVDRIFAGWVNNETANENIVGTFRDTSVAPPVTHRSSSVFASNRGSATGGTANSPIFLPADPAPALVAPPLLDSGRAPVGVGGDSACLTTSRITSRTNLALGQRFLVEAVDSPGDGDTATHPGFPAARLVDFRFGLTFGAFLCFWADVTTVAGAANGPSIRLYSVLTQIGWQLNGEWSINPVNGAIAPITAPSAAITARSHSTPAQPAAATPAEVRPPTGLSLLARDART